MCNGASSRVTQGGTIAFLQPSPTSNTPQRPHLPRSLSLHLTTNPSTSQTSATVTGLEPSPEHPNQAYPESYIVIHRDGDLSSNSCQTETSILHRFPLPTLARHGQAFDLAQKLDLGVGGEGIIGRRVSFVMGREGVVGEGILGWN
ncbi:hypothetical protein Q7P37_006970 [Cladosporium fusiforme]